MDARKFIVGNTYYLVTYADEQLRVPLIETYFYLGTDILGDQGRPEDTRWYFQEADSYLEDGPYKPGGDGSTKTLLIAASDMLDAFLDIAGLSDELINSKT